MVSLNELDFGVIKSTYKNEWGYPEEFVKFLKTNNYKLLGQGSFSQVWGKPHENIVIRVNEDVHADCWPEFAAFCKNHKNPHFPRIGKLRTIQGDGDTFIVAIMEKLKPLNDDQTREFDENIPLMATLYKLFKYQTARTHHFQQYMSLKSKKIDYNTVIDQLVYKFKKQNPTFYEALLQLKSANIAGLFDLHPDNVMMRGKTMVITDPYSYRD